MKTKRCECCKQELEDQIGGQKYCEHCALYTLELRKEISRWKHEVIRVRRRFYGTSKGSERIR